MKTQIKIILGVVGTSAMLLLAGCVLTSVYPYYTAKDVVFEPRLVGRWTDPDKPEATNNFWEFTRFGTNAAYTLTVHDAEKETAFEAHCFRLKAWTFIDAVGTGDHDDFIPPHYLLKVSQIEPTLKMAVLDYDWMGKLLAKEPSALRHTRVDVKPGSADSGRIVLTADTAELQKFILKYVADTNAFSDNMTMTRLK